MEEELDEVEDGKLAWTAALKGFYDKFTVDLKVAQQRMRDVKRQEILTDEVCDKCGSKMAIKFGRFGQFLACTNYPECKNTRELAKPAVANGEGAAEENPYADETCEKCGKPMTLKRGRFGQFLACTGYPECKTTRKITNRRGRRPGDARREMPRMRIATGHQAWPLRRIHGLLALLDGTIKRETTGVPCPKPGCKGEILVKKSKRGNLHGCSEYPNCDSVFWDKPVAEACPQCGKSFLLEKYNAKKEETTGYCSEEGCDYKTVNGELAKEETEAKKSVKRAAKTKAAES